MARRGGAVPSCPCLSPTETSHQARACDPTIPPGTFWNIPLPGTHLSGSAAGSGFPSAAFQPSGISRVDLVLIFFVLLFPPLSLTIWFIFFFLSRSFKISVLSPLCVCENTLESSQTQTYGASR